MVKFLFGPDVTGRRAQQLPEKVQTGGMPAKGGERGRQEALWRCKEQFHAEV
jgi:hypothetical protein